MHHKVLAGFIVFFLFFSIGFFAIFYQLRVVTNAPFLTKTLADSGIYPKVSELVEVSLSNGQTDLMTASFAKIVAQSTDPVILQKQTEQTLTTLIDYFKGKSDNLNVNIDLTSVKVNIQKNWSTLAPATVVEEYEKLPACPEGTEINSEEKITCQSPSLSSSALTESVQSSSPDEALKNIPDSYNLMDLAKGQTNNFSTIRAVFKIMEYGFWITLALSLLLILCLMLLAWGDWPAILRWVGLSLTLPGGVILILNSLGRLSTTLLKNYTSGINAQTMQTVTPILENINRSLINNALIMGGAIFGLGIILIIISHVLPKPTSQPQPQLSQT